MDAERCVAPCCRMAVNNCPGPKLVALLSIVKKPAPLPSGTNSDRLSFSALLSTYIIKALLFSRVLSGIESRKDKEAQNRISFNQKFIPP